MALQFYKGQQIGGGGTTVLPMTRAEYEANKTVLDASDFLIDITDEPDQLATADEIGYGDTNMGYIGDIATNSLADKVETGANALYAHAVGEYFIDKDGMYRKCISAIQVGQAITNSNSTVTSVGAVLSALNSDLSVGLIATATATGSKTWSEALTEISSYYSALSFSKRKQALIISASNVFRVDMLSDGHFFRIDNDGIYTLQTNSKKYWRRLFSSISTLDDRSGNILASDLELWA